MRRQWQALAMQESCTNSFTDTPVWSLLTGVSGWMPDNRRCRCECRCAAAAAAACCFSVSRVTASRMWDVRK